jgi:Peptidase_C39 like family
MFAHKDRKTVSWIVMFVAAFALLVMPAVARAAGTGDASDPAPDVLTTAEAKARAQDEARYEAWRSSATSAGIAPASKARGRISALIVDGPYYYTWTPSHAQERTYWCGPATCQIIADYWGGCPSQLDLSQHLGTTTGGTDFTKVDDVLRAFTGKQYWYYGGIGSESSFLSYVGYGITSKHYPIVTDVHIHASVWPYYNYDHAGHIIPLEAYDSRYGTIRINDPYRESGWRAGGGNTFGHTTYSHDVIWNGVYNHFLRAVIR